MAKILVTEEIAESGLERLRAAGHEVDVRFGLNAADLVVARGPLRGVAIGRVATSTLDDDATDPRPPAADLGRTPHIRVRPNLLRPPGPGGSLLFRNRAFRGRVPIASTRTTMKPTEHETDGVVATTPLGNEYQS